MDSVLDRNDVEYSIEPPLEKVKREILNTLQQESIQKSKNQDKVLEDKYGSKMLLTKLGTYTLRKASREAFYTVIENLLEKPCNYQ